MAHTTHSPHITRLVRSRRWRALRLLSGVASLSTIEVHLWQAVPGERVRRLAIRIAAQAALGAALLFGGPLTAAQADAHQFGVPELQGPNWMSGHGVTVHSNTDNPNYDSGQTGPYGDLYQCVELAQAVWGSQPTPWTPNKIWPGISYAKQIYASAQSGWLHSYASVTTQGSIRPQDLHPGDLITYASATKSGAGHVVVVDSITENPNALSYRVQVVGQNQGTAPGPDYGAVQELTLANGSLPAHILNDSNLNVQGVVHANKNPYFMNTTLQYPGDQVVMTGTNSGYELLADGTVKNFLGTVVSGALWSASFPIARDLVVRSNETSGYILDGYGGIHPWGGAPQVTTPAYWPGWDIARSMVLYDDNGGYVLDGWGGIHRFGDAPQVTSTPAYWPGFDIARSIVLLPNHTGGYVLDGWGGIHPFAINNNPPPQWTNGGPYWAGRDIARDIVIDARGTGGYVLDGFGGTHPFGIGSNSPPPGTAIAGGGWPGWDIARGIALDGTHGELVDGLGGLHTFTVPSTCTGCQ